MFSRLEGTVIDEHKGHYIINSFIHYVKVILTTEGVGIIIGVLFISSMCCIIFKPTIKKAVLLAFPILFSIISIVMNPSYIEPRHQLILYPFFSIVAGIAIYEITKTSLSNFKISIILSILLILPFATIIKNNIYISKTDTRTLAKYWIEANIPPDTKLLLDEYTPVLKNSEKNLKKYYEKSKQIDPGQFTTHLEKYYYCQMRASSGVTYDIKEIRHIWWRNKEIANGEAEAATEYDKDMANPIKTVGIEDYGFYLKEGYEYVITSNRAYGSFFKENSSKPKDFPSYKRFYDNLFSKGKLIKEFSPEELNVPGPEVRIFKL